MARRGRPKKSSKHVTYDSKEVRFVLALITFTLGVFALLSYLINGDDGLFGILRSLFGNVTFLFALFLLNLSLALFGAKYFLSTRKSLIAQALLLLFVAIFLMAIAEPLYVKLESYKGLHGGRIGYEVGNFLTQNIFLNFTGLMALISSIIILPLVFDQNMAEFFGGIFRLISGLRRHDSKQLSQPGGQNIDSSPAKMQVMPDNQAKTAMFGDFRNQIKQRQPTADGQVTKNIDSQQPVKLPDFVGINNDNKAKSTKNDKSQAALAEVASVKNDGAIVQTELKFPQWKLPSIDLLDPIPKLDIPKEDVKNNSTIIEQTLASFGIESKVMDVMVGPSVTQYALDIALGIKVSKISNLRNDLALALATSSNAVRIEVPIPGTSYVGIEIPNARRRPVFVREIVGAEAMDNPKFSLPVSVGKGIAGNAVIADIQSMPHLLIAGATGSGKSVLTNSFILSLLMKRTPDQLRFIMVDPKQVELSDYNGIPHLLTPVITEMDKVVNALKWSVAEMERRYTLFRESRVRNLEGYNQMMGFAALPYIVIVIDEMADMMLTAGRPDIETNIVRLAQKARATGMHLILATQRPSVNVITGLIKANIPGRIGMSVTTNIDSRVILDVVGAESLLGKGDLLFKEPDKNRPFRVQGVLVTQEEIQRVVKFIRDQVEIVEYIEDVVAAKDLGNQANSDSMVSGDNLFADSVRIIVSAQKGSASLLQRKLSIGYNRAAKLLDELEEVGVVGIANGAKPREVLITDAEGFLAQLGQK